MPVKTSHTDATDWFVTFTCYKWVPLFEKTNGYDLVYKWFEYMRNEKLAEVTAYVIMPNHVHVIVSLKGDSDLNKLVGNGKRFMAYEIVKRLEEYNQGHILYLLSNDLTDKEISKGQKHRVFEDSFDAKHISTDKFLQQKLNYIHNNPVSGKWSLVDDFVKYEHSSASFYELDEVKHFKPFHYLDIA